MTEPEIAKNDAIEQLTERLRNLESAGLPKPTNYLLSDYLRFLVDNELLPRETSDHVQAIYNAGRYGDAHIDEGILAKTLSQLDAALEALCEIDPPDIEALEGTLASSQDSVKTTGQVLAPPPVQSSLATFAAAPDVNAFPGSETAADLLRLAPISPPQKRLWPRIIAGGFLWTLIVLAAGYYGHDKVSALFQEERQKSRKAVDDRKLQEINRGFITRRRDLIEGAQTEGERQNMMRGLAQAHITRGEYGEYYFIYESLLRQNPSNVQNKIKLAELLLDTTTSWYRDPVRARKLVEEAVAVDSSPYSRKLLAEALYQTGDKERAIEIRREVDADYVTLTSRKQWSFRQRGRRFTWAMDEEFPPDSDGLMRHSSNKTGLAPRKSTD